MGATGSGEDRPNQGQGVVMLASACAGLDVEPGDLSEVPNRRAVDTSLHRVTGVWLSRVITCG
jgi:hypothetical protein